MDNFTYNIINTIFFVILTIAAIFIPLFFSFKASNKTDGTLKEIVKIISGVES
jgi:hypothetical protein